MNTAVFAATGFAAGAVVGAATGFVRNKFRPPLLDTIPCNTSFLFSGNLKQTSIVDAIQFLEIGKREGILHIYSGRRKGYITFAKGKVIDAFYRNQTAREAVFAMLDLEEGDFYFESKVVDQPRLISDSIMDIVMTWDTAKNDEETDNFLGL